MHIADLSKACWGKWNRGWSSSRLWGPLAAKRLGTGGVAISFVGDGGANQGTFLEASTWHPFGAFPACL